MTDLRTAAQQALEALWYYRATEWGADSPAGKAIHVLQAALAQEQAEQTWVCPDSPEHRYKKPGHCEDCGKTLVLAQHPGCERCSHPLYAATKCRVCGRVTEPKEQSPRWEGDHNIESPNNACMHKSYCISLKAALAQEQAEPVQESVSEMLIDDLCLLHLGWKSGPDGDLHRDIYRAAADRVIARAIKVRGLRKIKQLEGKT